MVVMEIWGRGMCETGIYENKKGNGVAQVIECVNGRDRQDFNLGVIKV